MVWLQNAQEELAQTKEERDNAVKELEFWTSTAAADKNEKNALALKFTTVCAGIYLPLFNLNM